ncbi:unnamed protein product [Prunus brigantina]
MLSSLKIRTLKTFEEVPPPLEHNNGRDESNDTDDPASDPIINEPIDDDMSDDHTTNGIVDDVADEGLEAQAHEKPTAKFQPRRSTRAPRQWYKKFDSFMIEHRYRRTTSDHCVFVKRFDDGEFIILLLYVDDMLIVGQNSDKTSKLKKELSKSFAMKDLGPAKRILGMSISRDRKNRKLRLSQESYIEKVLKRFNMDKAKPVSTPFPSHFKLSSKQSPTCEKEKENMAMMPYSSAVGSPNVCNDLHEARHNARSRRCK